MRAVRFRIVRHLVADPGRQDKLSSIGKLGMKLAFDAKQNVTFGTPMIGKVAGAVLDQTHSNGIKVPSTPISHSRFAFVLGGGDFRPGGYSKRDIVHFHIYTPWCDNILT